MSVDRLTEAGVRFSEILMAPLAVDPQEEQFIDKVAFKNGNGTTSEKDMTEGVEISFSDLPCEECPEERDLRIEEIAEYAGTREQFENLYN